MKNELKKFKIEGEGFEAIKAIASKKHALAEKFSQIFKDYEKEKGELGDELWAEIQKHVPINVKEVQCKFNPKFESLGFGTDSFSI